MRLENVLRNVEDPEPELEEDDGGHGVGIPIWTLCGWSFTF